MQANPKPSLQDSKPKALEQDTGISIIIPARNEEGNIGDVIERSRRAMLRIGGESEIVIVDDGSTDRTLEIALEASRRSPSISVVHHARSLGITASIRTGLRNSKCDCVMFLPADLESNPEEDVPKLFQRISEGADLVVGWRQGRSGRKIVTSGTYNLLCRHVYKVSTHDSNWIKCLRREVLEGSPWAEGWHRYLVILAAHAGYRVSEVKVNYYQRHSGKSKFGVMRIPKGFLQFLLLSREIKRMKKSRGNQVR